MSRYERELEVRSASVAARKSLHRRRRSVSPFGVVLLFGAFASVAFLAWSIFVRDAAIEVMGAALIALGTIYILIAAFATALTYRAGSEGHGGRSVLYAFVGGLSAIVAFVAWALGYVTLRH